MRVTHRAIDCGSVDMSVQGRQALEMKVEVQKPETTRWLCDGTVSFTDVERCGCPRRYQTAHLEL